MLGAAGATNDKTVESRELIRMYILRSGVGLGMKMCDCLQNHIWIERDRRIYERTLEKSSRLAVGHVRSFRRLAPDGMTNPPLQKAIYCVTQTSASCPQGLVG